MKNLTKFKKIKKSFSDSSFSDRIYCLIAHGSSLFFNLDSKPNSDIDLELILSKKGKHDYLEIKNTLDSLDYKIECQLRYLPEIQRDSLIGISGYKIFMYFAYANDTCLLGNNIYERLVVGYKNKEALSSILISSQIAFKDIRKSFFASQGGYAVNKNIMRFFHSIGMYSGLVDYKKLGIKKYVELEKSAFVPIIISKFNKELGSEDLKILKKFVDHYQKYKIYPAIFPVVDQILVLFEKSLNIKNSNIRH